MFVGYDFDNGSMQLILVAHRGRTTLQVADIGFVIGHNQGALELACIGSIDAEVGAQLHRATDSLRNIDEGSV